MSDEYGLFGECIDKFGFEFQFDMLAEELAELLVETHKRKREGKFNQDLFLEELADVDLMVSLFKWYYQGWFDEAQKPKIEKLRKRLSEVQSRYKPK